MAVCTHVLAERAGGGEGCGPQGRASVSGVRPVAQSVQCACWRRPLAQVLPESKLRMGNARTQACRSPAGQAHACSHGSPARPGARSGPSRSSRHCWGFGAGVGPGADPALPHALGHAARPTRPQCDSRGAAPPPRWIPVAQPAAAATLSPQPVRVVALRGLRDGTLTSPRATLPARGLTADTPGGSELAVSGRGERVPPPQGGLGGGRCLVAGPGPGQFQECVLASTLHPAHTCSQTHPGAHTLAPEQAWAHTRTCTHGLSWMSVMGSHHTLPRPSSWGQSLLAP